MAVRAQTHHTKRGGVARKGGEKSSFRVLSPLLVVVFVREEVVLLWGFLVEIYHEQAQGECSAIKGQKKGGVLCDRSNQSDWQSSSSASVDSTTCTLLRTERFTRFVSTIWSSIATSVSQHPSTL